MGKVPSLKCVSNETQVEKIKWSTLTTEDICTYTAQTETRLSNIELSKSAVTCNDINCQNLQHRVELCSLYGKIIDSPGLKSAFE